MQRQGHRGTLAVAGGDLKLPHIEPRNVQQLDSIDHITELQEVGRAVAEQVNIAHFAGFLQ